MSTVVYLNNKCYVLEERCQYWRQRLREDKERLNRLYGPLELRPEPLNQFPEIYGLGLRNTDANSLYPWRSWSFLTNAATTIQRRWRMWSRWRRWIVIAAATAKKN